MKIRCIPLKTSALVHYCVGCDRLASFDSDFHCWFCGCDPPSGVPTDDEEDRDSWADVIYRYRMTVKGRVIIQYLYSADDHPPVSTPTERELGIKIDHTDIRKKIRSLYKKQLK